ncbi:MAG: hypothetical protein RIS94_306 [Pseudomonadota bacterium]|jgi:UDP-perosamine 4-acetyltransferase
MFASDDRPVVILGAGGHARVLRASLVAAGRTVAGFVEKVGAAPGAEADVLVIGDESVLDGAMGGAAIAIGIGAIPSRTATGLHVRRAVFQRHSAAGSDRLIGVIDPSAVIRGDVAFGLAVQVMAGAVIQTGARLGHNVVANTGCRIEHDCDLGDHAFVGPGAVLCGGVVVGRGAFIGANATILPGVAIGADAVIAAGSCVARDVPADGYHSRSSRSAP